eukprot:404077_1
MSDEESHVESSSAHIPASEATNVKHDTINSVKPFWLANVLVDRPKSVIAITVSAIVVMAVIIGLTGRFKLADNGDQDFILVNHEATRTMNGLALAEGIAFGDTVSADSLQQIRSSQIDEWRFILMFRSAEGNNLFTPENVAVMRNIENFILTP